MEIRELELPEWEQIYENRMKEDFPENELKPFLAMKQMRQEGIYRAYGLKEENELFAYWCMLSDQKEKTMLLDYFAVRKDLRGQGYGRKVIQLLADTMNSGYTLFVESENPDGTKNAEERALRERRIRFYQSCGCNLLRMHSEIVSTPYRIFCISKEKNDEETLKRRYLALYRDVMLPKERFAGRVKVF